MANVSVIMGIYNCADTLPKAIDSLLAQTFTDWNLVMCDDGSRDATYEVAERYRRTYPERITLLKNEQNMGLNYTLNRCLSIADGAYIARQDGDDVSMPTRFEKEAAILDASPDIAIVSTAMTYFDENGVWGQSHPVLFPENRDFIAGTPFCHAPCMVRREAYQAVYGRPALSARGGLRPLDQTVRRRFPRPEYPGAALCHAGRPQCICPPEIQISHQ